MSKTILVATLTTASLLTNIGCATKKYVRNQLTPINNKIGELDEISSKNSKEIQEVNGKASRASPLPVLPIRERPQPASRLSRPTKASPALAIT